jgi:hypothetical protein
MLKTVLVTAMVAGALGTGRHAMLKNARRKAQTVLRAEKVVTIESNPRKSCTCW